MGGRSEGGVRFEDSAMVFSGDIDTNGGGFSSVRLKLLETLEPGHDPVEAPAFEPEAAWRIGLMLNDVEGGPFELAVDRVEVCG